MFSPSPSPPRVMTGHYFMWNSTRHRSTSSRETRTPADPDGWVPCMGVSCPAHLYFPIIIHYCSEWVGVQLDYNILYCDDAILVIQYTIRNLSSGFVFCWVLSVEKWHFILGWFCPLQVWLVCYLWRLRTKIYRLDRIIYFIYNYICTVPCVVRLIAYNYGLMKPNMLY